MKKALLIGLGSAGMEVLSMIRERMRMEVGDLNRVSFIEFLGVETDVANNKGLPDSDFLEFGIGQNDINLIYKQGLNVELDTQEPHNWLHGLPRRNAALTGGAQGERFLGRLCFMCPVNLRRMRDRITNKIASLLSLTEVQAREKWGGAPAWELAPDIVNVYVFGTAGGGTHSGCMIDVGYLLRYIRLTNFPNSTLHTLSYTVLPKWHPQAKDDFARAKILANAYGLLNDLVYFTEPGQEYSINFSFAVGQNLRRDWWPQHIEAIQGPYDYNYLMCGSHTEGEHSFSEVKEILAMYLYSDVFHDAQIPPGERENYAGEAAMIRDARRVDMNPALWVTEGRLGQRTCFLTFGTSEIEFDTGKVIKACAAKLLDEAWSRWKNRRFAGIEPAELADGAILTSPDRVEGLLLNAMVEGGEKGLLHELALAPDQLFKHGVGPAEGSLPPTDLSTIVAASLSRDTASSNPIKAARDLLFAGFQTDSGTGGAVEQGQFARAIRENAEIALEKGENLMSLWARDALKDPYRGPDHVLSGLKLLKQYAEYKRAQREIDAEAENNISSLLANIQEQETNIDTANKSETLGFIRVKPSIIGRELRIGSVYIWQLCEALLAKAVDIEIGNLFGRLLPFLDASTDPRNQDAWDLLNRVAVFKQYALGSASGVIESEVSDLTKANPITAVLDLFDYEKVTSTSSESGSEFIRGLQTYNNGQLTRGSLDIVKNAVNELFQLLNDGHGDGQGNPIFDPNSLHDEITKPRKHSSLDRDMIGEGTRYASAGYSDVDRAYLFSTTEGLFRHNSFEGSLSVIRKFFEIWPTEDQFRQKIQSFIYESKVLLYCDETNYPDSRHTSVLVGPGLKNSAHPYANQAARFLSIASQQNGGPSEENAYDGESQSKIVYLKELGGWPTYFMGDLIGHFYREGVLYLIHHQYTNHVARADVPMLPPTEGVGTDIRREVKAIALLSILLGLIRRRVNPPSRSQTFEFKDRMFPWTLSSVTNSLLKQRIRASQEECATIYTELDGELRRYIMKDPGDRWYRISDDGIYQNYFQGSFSEERVQEWKQNKLKELDDPGGHMEYDALVNEMCRHYSDLSTQRAAFEEQKANWLRNETRVAAGEAKIFPFEGKLVTFVDACYACPYCGRELALEGQWESLRKDIVEGRLRKCRKCNHHLFTGWTREAASL